MHDAGNFPSRRKTQHASPFVLRAPVVAFTVDCRTIGPPAVVCIAAVVRSPGEFATRTDRSRFHVERKLKDNVVRCVGLENVAAICGERQAVAHLHTELFFRSPTASHPAPLKAVDARRLRGARLEHGTGPESPRRIAAAIVKAHRGCVIRRICDFFQARIHRVKTIKAIAQRGDQSAARGQRDAPRLAGHGPMRVLAGRRIESIDRSTGDIDPIQFMLALAPQRAFGQRRARIERQTHIANFKHRQLSLRRARKG